MHPAVSLMLKNPRVKAQIERALAAQGSHGDTMLAHINPHEAMMLHAMGGAGTTNPKTGLRQFYEIGGDGPNSRGTAGSGNLGQGAGGIANGGDALGGGYGGGYGGGPGNNGGSGLGANGGNSGNNYYSQNYSAYLPPQSGSAPAAPAPAPINNTSAPPVSTTPMMSAAQPDLVGSRFGPVPDFATQSYQIGTAPTSYPTPGVDASLGAPGSGGGVAPGMGGAGASGVPGGVPAGVSGIGTGPGGVPMQATADAYSPQMLAILQKLGVNVNPVAHQLAVNSRAASYGATSGNLAHPYVIQGAQPAQQPAQQNNSLMSYLTGKPQVPQTPVKPPGQASTAVGINTPKKKATAQGAGRNL